MVAQSVCGISVVKDYYKLQKFNVMEIATVKNLRDEGAEGRVLEKTKETQGSSSGPVVSQPATSEESRL